MNRLKVWPRDAMYKAIVETYGPKGMATKWPFHSRDIKVQTYMDVTNDCLNTALRAFFEDRNDLGEVFRETRNQIWTWYAGGSTANICATRFFESMGLEVNPDWL